MHFYGHPDSGHAHKVALALRFAGIAHDFSWIDIWAKPSTRPADFLAASRWHEVPCLRIDGESLIQSGAILLMLAERFDALGGRDHRQTLGEWVLWEANRIGMCIPQLIWARDFPDEVNPGAREWLHARLALDLERLEASLAGRDYLIGDAVSLADLCVYGYVGRHAKAGIELPPNSAAWVARLEADPSYLSAEAIMPEPA